MTKLFYIAGSLNIKTVFGPVISIILPQGVGGDIIAIEIFAGKKELNMPSIGGWEWLIILVIVVIIFGVGKLPEIGGALGKSIREFRESSSTPNEGDDQEQDESSVSESKA